MQTISLIQPKCGLKSIFQHRQELRVRVSLGTKNARTGAKEGGYLCQWLVQLLESKNVT